MGSNPDSSGFPSFHPFYHSLSFTTIRKGLSETFHFWQPLLLLFTRCATSNASRHFKSPLAMGRDAFKSKHASSVSISGVIDTGVNSNLLLYRSCKRHDSCMQESKKCCIMRSGSCSLSVFCTNEKKKEWNKNAVRSRT